MMDGKSAMKKLKKKGGCYGKKDANIGNFKGIRGENKLRILLFKIFGGIL